MTDARTVRARLGQERDVPPALREPDAATAAPHVVARLLLALYAGALALIAFWPVPVDRGAAGFLRAVSQAVPWLSYGLIEFSANVLLFVPFGVLVPLVWPTLRGMVVPLALAVTLTIESAQGLLLAQRTLSLRDVVANVLGAAIGLVLVWLARPGRRHGTVDRAGDVVT